MDFTRESRVPVPTAARGAIAVDAPPPIPASPPANPLARLMPIAMLVAAVGMMAVYFTSGSQAMRHPMYAFFPVMMLTSVLGTLVYSRGANRTADLNTERRKYLDYLDTLDQTTAKAADTQRESSRWNHPEPRRLWTLAGDARMWERRPDDPDFCAVRIGVGDQQLNTEFIAPELGAEDEIDPVTVTAMRRLIQERSTVASAPFVVPLRSFSVLTVYGDVDVARALVRAMICQLAVWHGPDDLTICAVVGAETGVEWDWLKWLPHHQHWLAADEAGPARLANADSDADSRHVVMVLDGGDSAGVCVGPDATIIDIGASLDGLVQGQGLHVSADAVREQDSDKVIAEPDLLTVVQASVCARRLAPYRVTEADRRTTESLDWLNLMAIDGVDIEKLWATTDGHIKPVPIGVAQDGIRVTLDINEAAHNGMGPHGLCVGATGSGKSELLRTLALGMITSHPPDVLNLILVDFKGGATFLGLERARHVGAVITNLAAEAPLVTRMNDALTGEMNRRQQLLRAGGCANLGEYRRARAKNPSLAALPALFILVDEFSELLSQHPEFAELFVAIGRLGRSLGIHLLLASQRLDEGRLRGLETHLSYRICLKTFSAAESRAVLGVPDAYNLPSTPGAAYLKSAEGELVRFQTAYVSGQGRPRRSAPVPRRPTRPLVFTASRVGSLVEQVAGDRLQQPDRTVLDTMLDRLAGRGPRAHQVWLPPLTESPTLDMVAAAPAGGPSLAVSIGVVDNPYEQRRDLLIVDLDGSAGNVAIVGAPRSGKSTALRTIMLALAQRHAPATVAFYCLDLGGGVLSSLRHLPHVGSMAARQDAELCRRTVAMASSVIRKRESTFRRLGIDSMAEYRRRRATGETVDDPFGDVFLVIDGWATLRQEFDFLEATITAIAAQGLSFGVHVVVTASRWAELRPALKDQIATRIELRLGDPAESEIDRKRARELSLRPPGRGISTSGREFAIALPRWDGEPTADGLADVIVVNVQRLRDRWAPGTAPQVQLLPTKIHRDALGVSADHGSRVLIGIGERELTSLRVDFAEQSHLLVLGESGCGKTALLRLLCRELIRTNTADEAQLEIVDFRRSLLGVVESDHLSGYVMSPASLTSRVTALVQRLEARMPGEDVTQQQLRTRSWWSGPDVYLVIDDYDLAAGSTGNPLAPLADFLPHAKDLGLHVVVARRSGGAARAMFDPVLAGMRELGCVGLMMSARPDDGVLLGTVRSSPLPPGRGTLITRGDGDQLIQVAWTDPP
ncbi:type VII secretion protein EccCa [Mycobacterium barrassiae]|uniref:type VII secretion protein EccCa n=1 Tax=Mycobacterium barrassiae TaxID=319709 RepID=UPI002265C418|nr:type VII secretion protein EccCa [Mycobacterium barrassiae]MCV7302425.1 type VII secretion protein EccCa [Mycobacterium barrassiae]